ncbi:MAG: ATP:cob(I)alamin adenosyltransferase [Verrucomicrobiota bacterium]|nr:ATP:cob(I)alamin adenosyltransferase [Verrucomicrobiota bacterium]
MRENNQLENSEMIIYLNRLSDTLWLLARWVEMQMTQQPEEKIVT